MKNKILKKFSLKLRAGKIESGPPLSTILGNLAINTNNFVKEFNEYTLDLPDYFLLDVCIIIYNDRTYEFIINEPTLTLFFQLLSFNKDFRIKGPGGYINITKRVIKLNDIIKISFFKFGECNDTYLRLICGSIYSMKIYVIK